jgi:hypothetical protein
MARAKGKGRKKGERERLTYYEAVRNISFMTTEGQQSKWAHFLRLETLKRGKEAMKKLKKPNLRAVVRQIPQRQ